MKKILEESMIVKPNKKSSFLVKERLRNDIRSFINSIQENEISHEKLGEILFHFGIFQYYLSDFGPKFEGTIGKIRIFEEEFHKKFYEIISKKSNNKGLIIDLMVLKPSHKSLGSTLNSPA